MSASPANDASKVIESAWHDQAVWSAVAGAINDSIRRWRKTAAIGAVLGVLCTALAGSLANQALRMPLTVLGVLLLAVVPYVQRIKVTPEQTRAWTRARNVSELLKEAIYRHLMGLTPVDPVPEGATPLDPRSPVALLRRCRNIRAEVGDLATLAAATQVAPRERPVALTLDGYIDARVNQQIEHYYYPRARENAQAAQMLRSAEFALGLLAVALGALSGSDELMKSLPALSSLAPWVGVVTTAGGAVTAHLAASRYDHSAATFFATGERLRGLRDEWLAAPAPDDATRVAQFVDDIERAISAENEAWVTDWNKSP
jgi:hypothetical protein